MRRGSGIINIHLCCFSNRERPDADCETLEFSISTQDNPIIPVTEIEEAPGSAILGVSKKADHPMTLLYTCKHELVRECKYLQRSDKEANDDRGIEHLWDARSSKIVGIVLSWVGRCKRRLRKCITMLIFLKWSCSQRVTWATTLLAR
jgi:hypothetical protein